MKKLSITIVLLLGAFHLLAQQSKDEVRFQAQSLSAEQISEADVETVGGNILLQGTTGDQARIEVYLRPVSSNDVLSADNLAYRLSQDYELSIAVTGHKLVASAKAKPGFKNWDHGYSISFRLYLPKSVSSHLLTNAGNIGLHDLSGGTHEIKTTGGNLEVKSVSGKVNGLTTAGNIRAGNSKGEMTFFNSGGGINLENLSGTINVKTTDSEIRANQVTGSLVAFTKAGSMNLTHMACTLDASTSDAKMFVSISDPGKGVKLHSTAEIDVQLPGNTGLDLKLYSATIQLAQPDRVQAVVKNDRALEGKWNGGGVPLTIDAGRDGKIYIKGI